MDHPLLETLADLIRIRSVNPNYEGGVPERELADYVQNYFASRGIETSRFDVFEDRPNVIAKLRGADSSRRILLEAHLDTVSVKGMTIDPWEPTIRDGKMYGRGACDTKGGMAAMMHAVGSIAAEKIVPPCDVWFAATIDEEFSFRGVVALCSQLESESRLQGEKRTWSEDAAIVAEPTSLQPVIASKGLVRWKIETLGRAAHSAKPHLGVNAIERMATVIQTFVRDNARLATNVHPLLGPATLNIGVIRGGVQINFVPDTCEIEIDRRMLPGETVQSVLSHSMFLLESIFGDETSAAFHMHPPMLTDVPLETDPDSQAVRTMTRVLESMGLDATLVGVPFCSDASKFGALGIPSLILGPGSIDQAHAAIEFVDCGQVLQAAEIYRRFILEFSPLATDSDSFKGPSHA